MNKTKVSLVAGEPGAGKSYTLIQQATDKIILGKSVYIMTPTHSAKHNLLKEIHSQIKISNSIRREALNKLQSSIHVLSNYHLESEIFIDEAGMINVNHLFGLLYQTNSVGNAHIHLFGDIKQLPPVIGNSIVEELLRFNIEDELWNWVNNKAYSDFQFDFFETPTIWQLENNIDITTLRENHRLNRIGYTSYDNDFYNSVIDGTIEKDNYTDELIDAINNDYLILVPTHARGEEIDEAIRNTYGQDIKNIAPFIRIDKNLYINPFNIRKNEIADKFSTIEKIDEDKIKNESAQFTCWTTVHKAQGATVDSVCFYLGNNPIAPQHKEHYSNNMLYTSLTRARSNFMLLGLKSSFEKMRSINPKSAQQKLRYFKAEEAKAKLFITLRSINQTLNIDEIYDLYEDIFNDIELSNEDKENLEHYNISSDIYSKKELIKKFKNYADEDFKVGFNHTNYKVTIYDKYVNSIKAKNKSGKGKTQKWISSLNNDEIIQVKNDINNLSIRKFKEKYGYDKRIIEL